jgi:tetratricopeptide (TPR) repeat protein
MIGNSKFWVGITIFQVVFGLTVFAITRQYYIDDSDKVSAISGRSSLVLPGLATINSSNKINASTFGQSKTENPVELARQANEFFSQKQYENAVDAYEQLLALDPRNVETYNNLGITLHYLGKSTEALEKLNEGIALESTHQRIWLTLGYVNGQIGNYEQARTSLTTALKMNPDNEIGQSAVKMLENLP